MSKDLLASKVVVVEEEPRVRGIPSLSTSETGAVGVTERGPIGKAIRCTSFEEYSNRFGGFTPNSDLTLAAAGFQHRDCSAGIGLWDGHSGRGRTDTAKQCIISWQASRRLCQSNRS